MNGRSSDSEVTNHTCYDVGHGTCFICEARLPTDRNPTRNPMTGDYLLTPGDDPTKAELWHSVCGDHIGDVQPDGGLAVITALADDHDSVCPARHAAGPVERARAAIRAARNDLAYHRMMEGDAANYRAPRGWLDVTDLLDRIEAALTKED